MAGSLKLLFWKLTGPYALLLVISSCCYFLNISLISLILIQTILLTITSYCTIRLYNKQIIQPVADIIKCCEKAALGDLSQNIITHATNEIRFISESVNQIIDNQIKLSQFVSSLGEGKYDAAYTLVSEKDKLGLALINMRDQLLKVSSEDKKRSWANTGLTQFSETLRTHNEDIKTLSEILLCNLVKYVEANQGGIFLLKSNQETNHQELTMSACYAWGRKKFQEKIIQFGCGLVGQCALEKDTIYLEEVPDNYVTISSGLGESNPSSVLIVPIMVNDTLQGILELASFKRFEKFQIEFIEKLCESMAATLSSARINEHTRYLLEESNKMTNNMKVQEEELRQNAEELQATQESLSIKLAEAKAEMLVQIQKIESEKKKNVAVLEGCVDGVITFNCAGNVEFFNNAAEEIWGLKKEDVLGRPLANFISIDLQKTGSDYIATHLNGSRKEIDVRTEVNTHNAKGDEVSVLMTLTKAK